MKLKDFLQVTFEQGDVRGDDVAALLGASALAELELPDVHVNKFKEAYLTRTRAENDPEIIKKIKLSSRAEILDGVDRELEKLYPLIDQTKAAEIQKDQSTFKKIQLLSEALGEAQKAGKTTVDKSVQKVEEEWSGKVKTLTESHKVELENLKKLNEENNLNFALKSKLLTFELSEAFSALKEPLTETIIGKIKGTKTKEGNPIVIDLDPTGNLNVRQNIEGILRDVFENGNEKLTIDKLIAPLVEPFIKKSTGSGGTQQSNGKKPVTPAPDLRTETLAEKRLRMAETQ